MTSRLAPEFRFYSPHHVLIATAVGGPLAGAFIVAANSGNLGKRRASNTAIVVGVLVTGLLMLIAWFMPPNWFGPVVVAAYALAAQALAVRLQGQALAVHMSSGGRMQSRWRAAGVGAASLVTILLVILLAALVLPGDWLPR